MANSILDQINRRGDIIKYVQAMRYTAEQDRIAQQRQKELDALSKQKSMWEIAGLRSEQEQAQRTQNVLGAGLGPQALVEQTGDVDTALKLKELQADTSYGETPTDVDDFVKDASAAWYNKYGTDMPPDKRNEARLQFKRAQASEVAANRLASRAADAQTAEKINYNSELGTRLAQIATNAALMESKGEVSDAEKATSAKGRMEGNLSKLAGYYVDLDSLGGIVNTEESTLSNVWAAGKSSSFGQWILSKTGSDEQSIRNAINKLKPLIIQDIRQSTNMSARGLDSEKELEFYLQAATDEKSDIQSNMAALVVLSEAYGDGTVAKTLRNSTNEDLIRRIADKGAFILSGGGKRKVIRTGTKNGRKVVQYEDGAIEYAE